MVFILMTALVACGDDTKKSAQDSDTEETVLDEDTKESIQKTVDDLQAKMTEVTQSYENAFTDKEAMKDPAKASEAIDKAIEMVDDAIEACESVKAPGPDSKKYRDMCKDMFSLFRDMISEMRGIDVSDAAAAEEVSKKYLSDILKKTTEASDFVKELQEKYGITISQTTTTTGAFVNNGN